MNATPEGVSTLSPNARAMVLVEMEPLWQADLIYTTHLTTTCTRVYVMVNQDEPGLGVIGCNHRPMFVDRFGEGLCHCGARMWSPWWVADGVMGHGTAEWVRQHENTLIHQSMKRIEVSS